jgi:hypothetical protein
VWDLSEPGKPIATATNERYDFEFAPFRKCPASPHLGLAYIGMFYLSVPSVLADLKSTPFLSLYRVFMRHALRLRLTCMCSLRPLNSAGPALEQESQKQQQQKEENQQKQQQDKEKPRKHQQKGKSNKPQQQQNGKQQQQGEQRNQPQKGSNKGSKPQQKYTPSKPQQKQGSDKQGKRKQGPGGGGQQKKPKGARGD